MVLHVSCILALFLAVCSIWYTDAYRITFSPFDGKDQQQNLKGGNISAIAQCDGKEAHQEKGHHRSKSKRSSFKTTFTSSIRILGPYSFPRNPTGDNTQCLNSFRRRNNWLSVKEESGDSERPKRNVHQQEISFERKQPACQERLAGLKQVSEGLPIQVVSMVEEGEDAKLTCHYCGDANTTVISMLWYRIGRDAFLGGIYTSAEVKLDKNDDDQLNRVFVGADHTLHIRKAKISDVGTYYCTKYTGLNQGFRRAQYYVNDVLRDKNNFRFFYHFDVIKSSDMEVREISRTSSSPDKSPAPPVNYDKMNLVMDTSWERWGVCSICGKVGQRKRLGVCYLKKLVFNETANPWYIDNVMKSYPAGVPCRSSLFHLHSEIKARADEMESEECEVPCFQEALMGKENAMSPDGIRASLSFYGEIDKSRTSSTVKDLQGKRLQLVTVREGSSVNLTCPDVPVDTPVVWLNNTRVVGVNSSDRVVVHANNVLQILSSESTDTGTYHCLTSTKIKVKIKLRVTPRIYIDTETWRFASLVALTYPLDMVLFLLLLFIKHKHRHTARSPSLSDSDTSSSSSCSSRSGTSKARSASTGSELGATGSTTTNGSGSANSRTDATGSSRTITRSESTGSQTQSNTESPSGESHSATMLSHLPEGTGTAISDNSLITSSDGKSKQSDNVRRKRSFGVSGSMTDRHRRK